MSTLNQKKTQQDQQLLNYALIKRLLIFAGLWVLLTQGELSSWVIGLVIVLAATGISLLLMTPTKAITKQEASSRGVSILSLLFFIPFFLWQSLRGGWQTARLALHPNLPLQPGFIAYKTNLPLVRQGIFFCI